MRKIFDSPLANHFSPVMQGFHFLYNDKKRSVSSKMEKTEVSSTTGIVKICRIGGVEKLVKFTDR